MSLKMLLSEARRKKQQLSDPNLSSGFNFDSPFCETSRWDEGDVFSFSESALFPLWRASCSHQGGRVLCSSLLAPSTRLASLETLVVLLMEGAALEESPSALFEAAMSGAEDDEEEERRGQLYGMAMALNALFLLLLREEEKLGETVRRLRVSEAMLRLAQRFAEGEGRVPGKKSCWFCGRVCRWRWARCGPSTSERESWWARKRGRNVVSAMWRTCGGDWRECSGAKKVLPTR